MNPYLMDVSRPGSPALETRILDLLGDEPEKENDFGPEIHRDLASWWSNISMNGLKEDSLKNILANYKIPNNLQMGWKSSCTKCRS